MAHSLPALQRALGDHVERHHKSVGAHGAGRVATRDEVTGIANRRVRKNSGLDQLRGSETSTISVCAQFRIQNHCQNGRLIRADPSSKIHWDRSEEWTTKLRRGNLEYFRRWRSQPILDIRQKKWSI